tara:strand:+ start:1979 stop:2323 length:345 start_codon:yes stop_codon:yes gene_type:complete
MQTYVDARIVAGLVKYFQKIGVPHKSSYSHMLNQILKAVHADWECEHFETTEEALQYLSEQGFSVSQIGTPGRGDKILRAMNKDALKEVSEVEEAPTVNRGRTTEIAKMFDQKE